MSSSGHYALINSKVFGSLVPAASLAAKLSAAQSQASGSSASVSGSSSSVSGSQSERSKSARKSESSSGGRRLYIIKPKLVVVPAEPASDIPTHTFLSISICLLLYLAVLITIVSVECPFDREVTSFFVIILLAFTACVFVIIINLSAVRHHRYDCLNTSLSLLYSGSAALVIFGLVQTGIFGLCRKKDAAAASASTAASIFYSGVTANYFLWVLSCLAVLWQLVAYYYYG